MPRQTKVDKKEAFELLIGTHKMAAGYRYSASKVASYFGVDRAYISRLVNEFLSKNLIYLETDGSHIKLYSATGRDYDQVYGVKPKQKKGKQKLLTESRPSRELCLQKQKYKIEISREHTDFFEKQRHYKRGNCSCYKFRSKIFDQFGEWEFEKQGKQTLIVTVPEMFVLKSEIPTAKHFVFSMVYESLKWFSKHAHIKLRWNTLKCIEKPHITRKACNPEAVRVARKCSISIDGKMLDMSSGSADWETTLFDDDMQDALDYIDSWDAIAQMMNITSELEKRMEELDIADSNVQGDVHFLKERMSDMGERQDARDKDFKKLIAAIKEMKGKADEIMNRLAKKVNGIEETIGKFGEIEADPCDPMFA